MDSQKVDILKENQENPAPSGEKQVLRNNKGQFIKGVSGNPNGRPQGSLSLRTKLLNALEQYSKEKGKTLADVFADVGIEKAINGDYQFWKTIISYIDGMPRQNIELEGKVINIHIDSDIAEKNNVITPSTEDSSEGQS